MRLWNGERIDSAPRTNVRATQKLSSPETLWNVLCMQGRPAGVAIPAVVIEQTAGHATRPWRVGRPRPLRRAPGGQGVRGCPKSSPAEGAG